MIFVQVIAATVASDPTKYSEAFLGKPNEEYCAWILDSEKWGGLLSFFLSCFLINKTIFNQMVPDNDYVFEQSPFCKLGI